MTLPNNLPSGFATVFTAYGEALREIERSRIQDAQPEDQLKPPIQTLLRGTNPHAETRTEVRVSELEVRPDIGVAVRGLLCGHVELKAPGLGADTSKFRDRNKAQWEKLRAHPNLLYTDGLDFSLYRDGKRVGRIVRLAGDLAGVKSAGPADQAELHALLTDFFSWTPLVPKTPRALAEMLAPLCRLLREQVLLKLQDETSALALVNKGIREALLSEVDTEQFADIYAQTLTYSLLLARLNGEQVLTTESAARGLESGHGLLAAVLRHMTEHGARYEVEVPVSILERVIAAVDPVALQKDGRDPWLYFYEDFLAAYDRKLRNSRGVYYTPAQVIGAQVRLVADLLVERFGKTLAFAAPDVFVLDPAAGTSAYPLAVIQHALATEEAHAGGKGNIPARATQLARNIHAFELLVGPYAVGHLRLSQMIQAAGGQLPAEGIHVYLADTLESPHADLPPQTLAFRPLTEEHKRVARVKKHQRILVCLGNPPYDREAHDPAELDSNPRLQRKGGWVRHGDKDNEGELSRPILRDFIDPAVKAGAGGHLKNLYNDYVYFWRWALWKMFENPEASGPGIITFITASSYLRGPGFVGMRRKMREAFDDLWIIDLEGDQLGARKTENVFAIQTPVAIAVGTRYGKHRPGTPAKVRYTKITGSQDEKFAALDRIRTLDNLPWQDCFDDWEKPFLPTGQGAYFDWPLLTDLFPWQHSGAQYKRAWPIGETWDVLRNRWSRLVSLPGDARKEWFHESRDRKADSSYPDMETGARMESVAKLSTRSPEPCIAPYAFRSFDRRSCFRDSRLGDFLRPTLWLSHGDRQVYMTSLLTGVIGTGPGAVACADVPDLHHFRGSFGGCDAIPLWRNPEGTEPNVTGGLLDALRGPLGHEVAAEDLFAYAYAVLAGPGYVERFSEELTLPGPRVPITKDAALFARAVALGRRLVWLHSYGRRMVPAGETRGRVPQGTARCVRGVPGTAAEYPEAFSCEDTPRILRVGKGEFAPVPRDVFEYSVSGLQVVKSWLRYRMKAGAGKSSSPLDAIRPEAWTAQMTQELLELLWVLEATVALQPTLAALLDEICAGALFEAGELPQPSARERQPPKVGGETVEDKQADLFDISLEPPAPFVAGVDAAARGTKHTRKMPRDPATKTDAAHSSAQVAYCPGCKKIVPQTPVGYPTERKGVVTQAFDCAVCGRRNRVETRVS